MHRGRGGYYPRRYQPPYAYAAPAQGPYGHPAPAAPLPVAPAPAPAPPPNRAGREIRRAFAAVVVDKVAAEEATVDRPILLRELTKVLERKREMARILLAAGGVGGGDTLKEFMRLAIDDPIRVAGFLDAIKVPTPESQQLQAI